MQKRGHRAKQKQSYTMERGCYDRSARSCQVRIVKSSRHDDADLCQFFFFTHSLSQSLDVFVEKMFSIICALYLKIAKKNLCRRLKGFVRKFSKKYKFVCRGIARKIINVSWWKFDVYLHILWWRFTKKKKKKPGYLMPLRCRSSKSESFWFTKLHR